MVETWGAGHEHWHCQHPAIAKIGIVFVKIHLRFKEEGYTSCYRWRLKLSQSVPVWPWGKIVSWSQMQWLVWPYGNETFNISMLNSVEQSFNQVGLSLAIFCMPPEDFHCLARPIMFCRRFQREKATSWNLLSEFIASLDTPLNHIPPRC